jgi:hypothetical protein
MLFDQKPASERVLAHPPLRPIRMMVDEAWKSLKGCKSIPPERLLPRVAAANVLHDPRRTNADGVTLLFHRFVGLSAPGPITAQ